MIRQDDLTVLDTTDRLAEAHRQFIGAAVTFAIAKTAHVVLDAVTAGAMTGDLHDAERQLDCARAVLDWEIRHTPHPAGAHYDDDTLTALLAGIRC